MTRSIENRAHKRGEYQWILNVEASRDVGVQSFTYAASSSTYGDHAALPKVEENIGNPLSPYAVANTLTSYTQVFMLECTGLTQSDYGILTFLVNGKIQMAHTQQ